MFLKFPHKFESDYWKLNQQTCSKKSSPWFASFPHKFESDYSKLNQQTCSRKSSPWFASVCTRCLLRRRLTIYQISLVCLICPNYLIYPYTKLRIASQSEKYVPTPRRPSLFSDQ
ncbi:unnamed protein product [Arctia plantaginis]|uniref:Uncharacterized protein n=1 Tax=Arctia plantaginis TaxID=874455 RepID=A0A8S1B682_ARCPL|nr:unnamed protein product [Arctia plantaginis]